MFFIKCSPACVDLGSPLGPYSYISILCYQPELVCLSIFEPNRINFKCPCQTFPSNFRTREKLKLTSCFIIFLFRISNFDKTSALIFLSGQSWGRLGSLLWPFIFFLHLPLFFLQDDSAVIICTCST